MKEVFSPWSLVRFALLLCGSCCESQSAELFFKQNNDAAQTPANGHVTALTTESLTLNKSVFTGTERRFEDAVKFDINPLLLPPSSLDFPFPFSWIIKHIWELLRRWSHEIKTPSGRACASAMLDVLDRAISHNESDYINVLDSLGKPKAGLQRGNVLWLGSFDQCRDAAERVSVKYCIPRLAPGLNDSSPSSLQRSLGWGLCIPSVCSEHDLEDVMNYFLSKLPESMAKYDLRAAGTMCYADPDPDVPSWVVFGIIILFAVLVLLTYFIRTIVVQVQQWRNDVDSDFPSPLYRPVDDVTTSSSTLTNNSDITMHFESKTLALLGIFDIGRNLNSIFCRLKTSNFSGNDDSTDTVYVGIFDGLRTLSLAWVILYVVYFAGRLFVSNPLDMMDHTSNYFLFQIIPAGGVFATDTFIVIMAMQIGLRMFRRLKLNGATNVNFFWYFLHRFVALWPLYVAFVFAFTYAFPVVIRGPFYLLLKQDLGDAPQQCKTYWWTNLLLINNFYPHWTADKCLPHTWYISLHAQLYVMAPVFIYLLYKLPVLGFIITGALTLMPMCVRLMYGLHFGLPVSWNQLPLKNADTFDANYDYVQFYPHTRCDAFFIGLMAAYVFVFKHEALVKLFRHRGAPISTAVTLLLGIAACVPIFCLTNQNYAYSMTTASRTVWHTVSHTVWSLFIAWLIVASLLVRHRGMLFGFLSHRAWQPLARLTYAGYLIGPAVLMLLFGNHRDTFYYHEVNMISSWIMILSGTVIFASVLAVLFEWPFRRIETFLKSYRRRSQHQIIME